jgi:dihydrolipoamide dehydrogenase
MSEKVYDIAIIGGGPGGYVAAIRAAQMGAKVALIEMERVGGCCLNRGCIPTKAMVHQAEVYQQMLKSAEYGLPIDGAVRIDFPRFMQRVDEVTETLVSGVEELIKGHAIDEYRGIATIVRPGLMRVIVQEGGAYQIDRRGLPSLGEVPDSAIREVTAKKIVVATGSKSARAPIPGNDLPGVLASRELLRVKELPRSMVIIGASVVGMEFACIFNALGVEVNVLARRTFLKGADDKLVKRFRPLAARQGIKITQGVDFREIAQADDGLLRVGYEYKGQVMHAEGQIVLLATGRDPYTANLGVGELGLEMDGRKIVANERLETSIPDVYAIGDVTGGYMLAHVASYEGEVAVENALGHERIADYSGVHNCIFTMPEIAAVGLTEEQAREQGVDYVVERFPFAINGRALGMGETEGQVRMICEKGSGKILGLHIMGARANDIAAEGAVAIRAGLTAKDLADTIHAHPTLPETIMEAAKAVAYGEAIHYRKV